MRFPRHEYCCGLPFPSTGDLSNPGIEPTSPALAGRFFTVEPPGKLLIGCYAMKDLNTKQWISLLKTRSGRTGWPEHPDGRVGTPWFSPGTADGRSTPFSSRQARVSSFCPVSEGMSGLRAASPHRSPGCCVWVGETRRRQGARRKTARVKQDTSKDVWRQFSNISVNYVQIIDSSHLVFKTDFPGLLLYNMMSALIDYWNQV